MPCSITKLLSGILPESLVNKYHETKKRKKSKKKKSKKYLSKQNNDPLKIFVHNILLKVLIIMLSGMTLLHRCKASLVLDKHAEDHIMFSKYCPSTPACPEGSHVMCMFFNPRSQYGPECIDPVNLEMTPEKANWLLDIFNAMRSKIARGEETGKGGMPLPRGYGLIRLQWDSELATFAQILADQCTENLYDQCRATERFKSPYQFVLGVQDRIDRWYEDKISTDKPWQSGKKLKEDKINEVIHMIFRHAYAMKNLVTPEEIVNPGKMKNHYINFVGGTSTHIGCAYILFSRYHPYNINNFEKMLQLICNLSASQEPGTSVYRTSPPGPDETELTKNCGCPPGYAEDSGCLCYAVERTPVECRDNEKCRPAVVVLPIITFEDAPPSHWIDNSQNMNSTNVSFRTNVPKLRHDFVPTVATRLMRPQGEEKRKAQLLKRRRKDRTRQIKYEAPVERRHIAWNPSKNVLMPFNSYLNGRPAMNNNYFESFTDIAPHTDIENDDNIEAKYGFSANDTLPELGRIKNKQKRRDLINLLNKLEREVNNIELEGAAKELLDSKIMQIYDKLMNSINEDTTHTQKTYPTEDFLLNHDENIDPMVISPRPDNVGDPFVREIPPTMQSHSKPVEYNEREFGVSNLRHQKSFHPGLSNAGIEVINRIQGFTTKLSNNRNDHGPETTFRKTSYEIDKTGKEKSEYRDPEKFRQMHEEEELKKKIFRTKSFDDYDFLSTERRKFYQEKLDNVKKKSDSKQTLTIPKEFEADRPVRRVRPASYSNSQLRSQYMEDRDQAILLHGF